MSDHTEQPTVESTITSLERAGRLADARECAVHAARSAETADRPMRQADLLAKASELALYTQGPEAAEKLARAACVRADHRIDDPAVQAASRINARLALARVCLRRHTGDALDEAQAALGGIDGDIATANRALAASGEDTPYEPAAHLRATRLKLESLLSARHGRPRDALASLDEAYHTADGYPELRARILLTWAIQLRNWGLFDEARRHAERSLEIRLQLGDHYGSAMCYGTLAFIYQRQGLWARERDALVADLRVCERIGGVADMPGLYARLADALIGLGKYAGASEQARAAIEAENQRLGYTDTDERDIDIKRATRVHGFAWRAMARLCLVQGRYRDGIERVERARQVFERVRDDYGQALCRLTEAHLALELARDAHRQNDPDGRRAACAHVDRAALAAQPTFVRLGAVPEAAESIIIQVESQHVLDNGEFASTLLAYQVLPMLQKAGLGNSPIYQRARECMHRIAPRRAIEHTVTRASMLRSLTAILTETDPQPGTAIAVVVGDEPTARQFALQATDRGGVVLWPDSECALAVILGPAHGSRAQSLIDAVSALGDGGVHIATAAGLIDLEHMWPSGVRARGEPVERALAGVRDATGTTSDPKTHQESHSD